MSPAESRHILDLFFAEITRPEYRMQWRWRPGDVAMWDNRATAHLAATDLSHMTNPEHAAMRRTMYRVTVLGDRPTGPDGYTSQVVAGQPLLPVAD
jgi:alpha-ketoglutarate-dependent taurine dioxygenase